ncbi:conserved hypothetical protein [Methylobacterium sp. 4-46]|uniref:hypothetical protein n=1 Tax=unclassified Methylobacterium TaxID=2615210 RepID=UPI000152CBCF|nr:MULTISPECIES: hypothetical protein [Methylobacterium]ACA19566.1 conserved hypothetical protein [Methylobacterium sp. 4-46]WFT78761.1 hypothetical protein QA634_26370 [Methylobacterium nodulans]
MRRDRPCAALRAALLGAGATAAAAAAAQERSLVLPHLEGERQGTIVGRAVACGAPEAQTQRAARLAAERMRRAVGQGPWQDRFLPAFNDAASLAAQLPPTACEEALAALATLTRDAP